MNKILQAITLGLFILPLASLCYAQQWQYEIKRGDTLWSIANTYLISEAYTKKLQQFNSIKDPYKLQPGTTISAPVEWLGNLPGSATIVTVSGDVEAIREGQSSKVDVGYKLQADDQIITGEDGVAVIEFSDKSTVRIYSNTQLSFNKFKQSFDGSIVKARISIQSGRIKVNTNPEKKQGHRLEIESPAAVTAVRGTEFRVGVEGDTNDTVTEVLSGRVSVSAQNREVAVKKLFGTKTEVGKSPIRPVKLLKAPEISVQDLFESKVGKIVWNKLDKAESYRVRVAGDEKLSNIIYDQVVSSSEVGDVFFPEDGEFYTSVRGVDVNDIEGLDGVAKFSVNARPDPPLIIEPKNNSASFDVNPSFKWAAPAQGQNQLHFQLSKDETFGSSIIDQVLDPIDHFALEQSLEPGDYYWRIARIDADGRGPFSNASKLSIINEPELTPEVKRKDSGSEVSLRFSHDPTIPRYHVQVARDNGFSSTIFEEWVEEDEFSFKTQSAGSYYIRLGIEDNESGEIQYSKAQKILVPYTGWKSFFMTLGTGLLIVL